MSAEPPRAAYKSEYGTFVYFAVRSACFNELQGMCYKHILPGEGITWADAEQYCIDHFDGHLASPTTQETSDHVLAICE